LLGRGPLIGLRANFGVDVSKSLGCRPFGFAQGRLCVGIKFDGKEDFGYLWFVSPQRLSVSLISPIGVGGAGVRSA